MQRVARPGAGHFLQLSFGVQHLGSHGWHTHNEWVRYMGRGATVACFHCEAVVPNLVALPPRTIAYSPLLQQEWLRRELQELAKVPAPPPPLLPSHRAPACSPRLGLMTARDAFHSSKRQVFC